MPENDRLTRATQTAANNAEKKLAGMVQGTIPATPPIFGAGTAQDTTKVATTEENPEKLAFGQQIRQEAKEMGQGIKSGLQQDFVSLKSYMDRLGEQRRRNIETRRSRREAKANPSVEDTAATEEQTKEPEQ